MSLAEFKIFVDRTILFEFFNDQWISEGEIFKDFAPNVWDIFMLRIQKRDQIMVHLCGIEGDPPENEESWCIVVSEFEAIDVESDIIFMIGDTGGRNDGLGIELEMIKNTILVFLCFFWGEVGLENFDDFFGIRLLIVLDLSRGFLFMAIFEGPGWEL